MKIYILIYIYGGIYDGFDLFYDKEKAREYQKYFLDLSENNENKEIILEEVKVN